MTAIGIKLLLDILVAILAVIIAWLAANLLLEALRIFITKRLRRGLAHAWSEGGGQREHSTLDQGAEHAEDHSHGRCRAA